MYQQYDHFYHRNHILILIFGHSIAMDVDLEEAFNKKMEIIMKRPAIKGDLGIRITEYKE